MSDNSLLTLNNDIWLSLTEEGYMDRFLLTLFNDMKETKVKEITSVRVSEISSSRVADKTIKKGEYKNLSGFCINALLDSVPTEVILLDEEIPYLKWWHDKSFFTLNYYYEHVRALENGDDDIKQRMVVSFLLDKELNLDKFHTLKYIDKPDPADPTKTVPDPSFCVHDLNFLCIPSDQNSETQLSLWASLLIATDMEEIQRITHKQLG